MALNGGTAIDRWGFFEWLAAAVSWILPAVLVIRVVVHFGRRIPRIDPWPLRWAKRSGLAVVGVVGYLLLTFCGLLCCFHPMISARVAAEDATCKTRLKQLAAGMSLYAEDWGERWPPANQWGDQIARRLPTAEPSIDFRCPASRNAYGYAFNSNLDRARLADVEDPAVQVLLFDSSFSARNAAGDERLLPQPGRHSAYFNNVAYADGHANLVTDQRRKELVWRIPKSKPPVAPARSGE